MKNRTNGTVTRRLAAVAVLLVGGCEIGDSAGITEGDGSVTLEVTLNADGTITQRDNGVTAAIEAGNAVRVLARNIDGEMLYDVTGVDVADLMENLRPVMESASPFRVTGPPEVMEALGAIPTMAELKAMSPEERAVARQQLEAARERVGAIRAEAMRGIK